MNDILYLCDRRACVSCSPECEHTKDITHATSFKKEANAYIEKSPSNYKKDISINRLCELIEADNEGRCVILSSRNDEIIHTIKIALNIDLYDWQKAYIFGGSDYLMPGRGTGKTTACILKLLLTDGPPIDLYKPEVLYTLCDDGHYIIFKEEFRHIYYVMYQQTKDSNIKIRKINFYKGGQQ